VWLHLKHNLCRAQFLLYLKEKLLLLMHLYINIVLWLPWFANSTAPDLSHTPYPYPMLVGALPIMKQNIVSIEAQSIKYEEHYGITFLFIRILCIEHVEIIWTCTLLHNIPHYYLHIDRERDLAQHCPPYNTPSSYFSFRDNPKGFLIVNVMISINTWAISHIKSIPNMAP
jgi:hypothetical protein